MADAKEGAPVKTIVVPKALEDFFAEKLRTRYAEQRDIEVIIDRRGDERRHGDNGHGDNGHGEDAQALDERRRAERRLRAGWWSLPDLPFEDQKAS